MGADWSSKVMDSVLGGLPTAWKMVPSPLKKRVLARLKDFNPFASFASNDDLLRALRLAWIDAALTIDNAARAAAATHEWRDDRQVILGFSSAFATNLRRLRSEAFDRATHPGSAPMDPHLQELVAHVPSALIHHRADIGQGLTQAFRGVVAAVMKCPDGDVPDVYDHLAQSGLPTPGTQERRPFGDLVYVVFAELIKSPTAYPEASQAFAVGLSGLGVELGQQCLAQLRGVDAQIDKVLQALEGLSTEGGLGRWLERLDNDWSEHWAVISAQMASVDAKLDRQTDALSEIREDLALLVEKVQTGGRIGHESGQLAYDVVLALAQRLQPDETLNFDSALLELETAVDVALELIAKGSSAFYQDRFIDEVLANVKRSIEAGELEKGAESFDQALVELEIQDARYREAAQRRKSQLLESAVKHAMLMRDPERVADLEEKLTAIHHPQRPAASPAFQERYLTYYREGNKAGLRLQLEVAIALARRRLKQVTGATRRVEACLSLGNALAILGERESTGNYLREAEGVLKAGLQACDRHRESSLWALLQNALGNVLQAIGGREASAVRLRQSMQAYQAALQALTQKSYPAEWSMAQNNLGNVLRVLGTREGDSVLLEQAAVALHEALLERTRERDPIDWASTQINLGSVLHHLGRRGGSTGQLLEAVEAYQGALEVLTYEHAPLIWGAAHANLGNVFMTLGRLEVDGHWTQKSVAIHEAALLMLSRERVPTLWAEMQNSLGNALKTLGEREGNIDQLKAATDCYQKSLLERTRDLMPLDWAKTQNNLGTVYLELGKRDSCTHWFNLAVCAFEDALSIRTRECAPPDWASTKSNLGIALMALGTRERSDEFLKQAERAHRDSLLARKREHVPLEWAMSQNNLALVLMALGRHTGQFDYFLQAEQAFSLALQERTRERAPLPWANLQNNLGVLYMDMADCEDGTGYLKRAVQAFKAAISLLPPPQGERAQEFLIEAQDRLIEGLSNERPS